MGDEPRKGRRRRENTPETGARRRGPKPTAARILAVRVLDRVDRVRSYADLALHPALAQSSLPAADRGLATELVYGTLRWRGRLDYALQSALERPLIRTVPLPDREAYTPLLSRRNWWDQIEVRTYSEI